MLGCYTLLHQNTISDNSCYTSHEMHRRTFTASIVDRQVGRHSKDLIFGTQVPLLRRSLALCSFHSLSVYCRQRSLLFSRRAGHHALPGPTCFIRHYHLSIDDSRQLLCASSQFAAPCSFASMKSALWLLLSDIQTVKRHIYRRPRRKARGRRNMSGYEREE